VADAEAGATLLDPQVGTLLYLVGSDAPQLDQGRNRLRRLVEEHPEHPLSRIGAIVEAANQQRGFASLVDGEVKVRDPDVGMASAMLAAVDYPADDLLVLETSPGDDPVGLYVEARRREIGVAFG
jgi:hypothetical protein